MLLLRILLYPFSVLYGLIVTVRNLLFDFDIIRKERFEIPVINVGNLSTGGTGKTPHVEYLIRLLSQKNIVATLSRGYKRKTEGFHVAKETDGVSSIGDEPMQFKYKYPAVTVAVDENRSRGIRSLLRIDNPPELVVLDDAYQHRYVQPSLNILLTQFSNLYFDDSMLPSGRLREPKKGAKRADIIVVTKSPQYLSPIEERFMIEKINPKPHQEVYFSYLEYSRIWNIKTGETLPFENLNKVILATGIVDSTPIEDYLDEKRLKVFPIKFPDHHNFTQKDIQKIKAEYDDIYTKDATILTTEKDAMRLINSPYLDLLEAPIFALEIKVCFHNQEKFDQKIIKHIEEIRGVS